ncbi:Pyruvate/Phosphoenolpyruvate kinase-like domain-containing protein [Aspergillus oleicola]
MEPGSAGNPLLTAAGKLFFRIKRNEPLECPGVFDGITARIALEEGFDGLYVGGITACASRMAQADADSGAQSEFLDAVDNIAAITANFGMMIIADPETGMGDPISVTRMVNRFIKSGVAAIVINDRAPGKGRDRYGHDLVMPQKEYLTRVAAAANAKDNPDDIIIIARSTGLGSLGADETIERLKNAEGVGADVIWMSGIANKMSPNDFAKRARKSQFVIAKNATTPNWNQNITSATWKQVALVLYPDASIGTIVNTLSRDLVVIAAEGKQPRRSRFETESMYRLLGFYSWDKTRPRAEDAAEEQLSLTPRAGSPAVRPSGSGLGHGPSGHADDGRHVRFDLPDRPL